MKNIFQISELKDSYICPVCNNKLIFSSSLIKCSNKSSCGIEFPIINDIPVLINENDSIFSFENFLIINYSSERIDNIFLKNLSHYFPSLSNNLSNKKKILNY